MSIYQLITGISYIQIISLQDVDLLPNVEINKKIHNITPELYN